MGLGMKQDTHNCTVEGPARYAATKSTGTDSRKQDEPSRKQQDGNLYPPVAMATPIRHREGSGGKEETGEGDEGGHAE